MRGAVAWCLLALFGVAVQSMLVAELSIAIVPDISLLGAVAAALVLGPAEGMLVACVLGLGADMLSGSLLGQHAFVRVIEFAVVRGFARQLDLGRFVPLTVMVFALSAFDAAFMAGIAVLFMPDFAVSLGGLAAFLSRALVTALAAPALSGLARRVTDWLSETEARREMRIETRRPVL